MERDLDAQPQPIALAVKETNGSAPPKVDEVHLVARQGWWNVVFRHRGELRRLRTKTNDPKTIRTIVARAKHGLDNEPSEREARMERLEHMRFLAAVEERMIDG